MADKVKLAPNIFSYPDFERSDLHMEISLGGVKKEDITLKVCDESFYIRAPQDDFEYVTSMKFCCPVKAIDTKARITSYNVCYTKLLRLINFQEKTRLGLHPNKKSNVLSNVRI